MNDQTTITPERKAALDAMFAGLHEPDDWKAPIDSTCLVKDQDLARDAVMFHTATEATFQDLGNGWARVTAKGYRAGPAGDGEVGKSTSTQHPPSESGMKWFITDAGRAMSQRPKQKNDCTVRALALATELSYDEAYDILADAGRECGGRFQFTRWLDDLVDTEFRFDKISFPAVKGMSRMNPRTFAVMYPVGTYIVKTAKHVFCVVNGMGQDTFRERQDRCIYLAYHVVKLQNP